MQGRRWHGLVLILGVALLIDLLIFTYFALPGVRSGPEFKPLIDGWVQGAGYVLGAVLCLLRAADRTRPDRALWVWFGLALSTRALGFVWFFSVVRFEVPPPYPSLSDFLWIATALLMMGGLLHLAVSRFRLLTLSLLLDGITGALATAGLTLALFYDTLVDRVNAPAPDRVVVTNLVYPLLDIVLLLLLIGVYAAYAWQPPPMVWALAGGVIGFAVTDFIFLAQVTAGTFHPGTLLSPLTLATNGLIAISGWLPLRREPLRRRDQLPGLVLPGLFALVCLGLLICSTIRAVPTLSVVFASAGVLLAIARMALARRTIRSIALQRRDPRMDELTGVANRSAFDVVLTKAMRERRDCDPLSLLVVSLDDIGSAQDTIGRDSTDDLLRLVANRLLDGLRGDDYLARIRRDAFGVILNGSGEDLAQQVAARLQIALHRPFQVGGRELEVQAGVGIAVFPDDARDPAPLLERASLVRRV